MSASVEMRIDIGGSDLIPHTFLLITDQNGKTSEYGFAPLQEHTMSGPGNIYITGTNSTNNHEYDFATTKQLLTDSQYANLMAYINESITNPPNYIVSGSWTPGDGTNCTGWAVEAWNKAGLPTSFGINNRGTWNPYGQAISYNRQLLEGKVVDLTKDFITDLQRFFNQAQTSTSPIILDLDGNGIDTISKSAGIHFDLDGNKFAETTGWVSKNDGLLVLDKNGNGKIDNGTELFGNNTLLKNGTKAANGFVALAELDNNKDGKIDASDTAYNQLRVWKDSNSNGLADTGELLTLTQAGVKSLNTGYTNQTQTDAQGNQHLQVGNYTRTDGSTRAMNDVWFATDNARTIDQDIVTVNATIAALPELQGFGNVRSLQQAMARDSSGKLQNLVKQFSSTTDTDTRHTLLNQILLSWTGADQYAVNSRGYSATDGRKIYAIEAFLGQSFIQGGWGSNPGPYAAAVLHSIYDKLHQAMYAQLMAQTHFKGLYNSINLSWNNTTNQFDIDVSATITALQTKYTADATAGATLILDFGNNLKTAGDFQQQVLAALQKQGNIAGQGFAFSLATMGYSSIIKGTANNDTLNGINGKDNWLVGNAGDDNISGGDGNNLIDGGAGNDSLYGGYGNDIYIFNKGFGEDTIYDYDYTTANIDTIRFGTGINPTDITLTRDEYNLYLSYSTGDKITVQNWGYGANYQIEKVEFANRTSWDITKLLTAPFMGTANNDSFSGTDGNDIFYGFAGNDTISGGNGNDLIDGGTGNDFLNGDYGNDIYIFNKGFGEDTISEWDITSGNADTIRFGTGINPTDITLTRDQYNLYLTYGTTDRITVPNWGYGADYKIEKVEFANGTSWDITKLLTAPFMGTANNDSFSGTDGNDIFYGFAGNDTISGGNGNDLIDGGTGNDFLNGDYGNDIYIFNKGFGEDTISEWDITSGNTDTIRFGTGINPTDITLTRDQYNLYLTYGTTDRITVPNWGYGADYKIEKVEFANGTSWDITKLLTAPFMGTANNDSFSGTDGNDIFYGFAGNDTISGGNGNDTINGGAGDDTLNGGNGNDILIGGIGKDTLVGGLGTDRFDYYNLTDSLLSGFDIITDFNATIGNDLFRVSTARAGFVNVGAVNSLSAAYIGAKLTAAAFKSNFAAQFSFGQKTFVAINDVTAGFNASTDAIIEVTGLTRTLNVNNFVII